MKPLNNSLLSSLLGLGLCLGITGCGDDSTTYSLLSTGQAFRQSAQHTKIDIVWVVDNSGSMASSQENLATNFPSFINKIVANGYDFRLAVTTTDAYLALSTWTNYYNQTPTPSYYEGKSQEMKAKFRDGVDTTHSGYFFLDPLTPNLHDNFMINARQGINGRGDERSFQSMRTALESPLNSDFFRAGAFLAVILLTDEDDFSHPGTAMYDRYDRPLDTVQSYVDFLDTHTLSTASNRRYSVNAISVKDQACLDSIYNGAQKIGVRVNELALATGGISGNICGDFSAELEAISNKILELSTRFSLNGADPVVETIGVKVNGAVVPKSSSNPAGDGGWLYDEASNSIIFQGNYIPPQDASIQVTFDPKKLTF